MGWDGNVMEDPTYLRLNSKVEKLCCTDVHFEQIPLALILFASKVSTKCAFQPARLEQHQVSYLYFFLRNRSKLFGLTFQRSWFIFT